MKVGFWKGVLKVHVLPFRSGVEGWIPINDDAGDGESSSLSRAPKVLRAMRLSLTSHPWKWGRQ